MYYAIDNIFPNIIFNFENNISFVWEPKNYYIDIFENVICLGFIGLKNKFVLGINFIHYLFFKIITITFYKTYF